MKNKLLLSLLLLPLFFPISARAADFSVRLGQPKTPTNQNFFKLTFVALDTRDDRNISVSCYKKSPGESTFSKFDNDKVLIPGGNTDSCEVNSSIMNAKGTYYFYVVANASGTDINSQTVGVDYNTDGPSTPVSYSKEKINNCDYKIKFKTANDNKTSKVQLFRSDNLNISVNNGSVIASQDIGPDKEGEIVNSVPDCNKNYYYVIRAVDSSDNVSGTVGDSFTTTTTTSTTQTTDGLSTGNQNTNSAIPLISGSQVTAPNQTKEDTKDGTSDTSKEVSVTVTPETSPTVLGTSTNDNKQIIRWILVPVLLAIGYWLITTKKSKKPID